MYRANQVAGAAAVMTRAPIVWSIRHSDVDPRHGKRLTHLTNIIRAHLSGFIPARIVCCVESAAQLSRYGYHANRLVVIPSGFDVGRFVKDQKAGIQVRAELSIPREAMVVGHLARFHPERARVCERHGIGVVARQYEALHAEVDSRGTARS
jgi:hypothetical protein